MIHCFAAVGDDRIHYLEAGQGDPIVLLHTGGASAHEFEAVIPLLAGTHRVIAWDMPGHGDSSPIYAHRSIPDYADALAGFLDALDIPEAVIVGASIGGFIAMDFAARFPARVVRTVLAEAPLRSPEWYVANWAGFEAMCAIPTTTFEETAPRFRELTPALHERWNIDRNKAGSWTIVDIAWAVRDFDAAAALARVTTPSVVVMGADGPTICELARWREIQPAAAIEIMADCAHFVMIDDPVAFTALVATA